MIRLRPLQFHYKPASSALPANANAGPFTKGLVENDEVCPWICRTASNDREIVASRLSTRADEVDMVRFTLLVSKTHDAQVPTNNTFQKFRSFVQTSNRNWLQYNIFFAASKAIDSIKKRRFSKCAKSDGHYKVSFTKLSRSKKIFEAAEKRTTKKNGQADSKNESIVMSGKSVCRD